MMEGREIFRNAALDLRCLALALLILSGIYQIYMLIKTLIRWTLRMEPLRESFMNW